MKPTTHYPLFTGHTSPQHVPEARKNYLEWVEKVKVNEHYQGTYLRYSPLPVTKMLPNIYLSQKHLQCFLALILDLNLDNPGVWGCPPVVIIQCIHVGTYLDSGNITRSSTTTGGNGFFNLLLPFY